MHRIQRLGINIDHVATVRNARGDVPYPSPVEAALLAQSAGADNITAHHRQDERHIRYGDLVDLKEALSIPLNLEMAVTDHMLDVALRIRPQTCCLVPELATERTTQGGLDLPSLSILLPPFVARLQDAGIAVSLFIDAVPAMVSLAQHIGANAVEFYTGHYAHATLIGSDCTPLLNNLRVCADLAVSCGLAAHAGHGLTYENVMDIAAIASISELNIGHCVIGRALMVGMDEAVRFMRIAMCGGGAVL